MITMKGYTHTVFVLETESSHRDFHGDRDHMTAIKWTISNICVKDMLVYTPKKYKRS